MGRGLLHLFCAKATCKEKARGSDYDAGHATPQRACVTDILPLLDEIIIDCNLGRIREAETTRSPDSKPRNPTIALEASTALGFVKQGYLFDNKPSTFATALLWLTSTWCFMSPRFLHWILLVGSPWVHIPLPPSKELEQQPSTMRLALPCACWAVYRNRNSAGWLSRVHVLCCSIACCQGSIYTELVEHVLLLHTRRQIAPQILCTTRSKQSSSQAPVTTAFGASQYLPDTPSGTACCA